MRFEDRDDGNGHLSIVRMKPWTGRQIILGKPLDCPIGSVTQHFAQGVSQAKAI